MIVNESCFERGCACYDDRFDFGVEVSRKEWVGLTDEETKQLWHKARLCIGPRWMVFKRMIEAALKEKNT